MIPDIPNLNYTDTAPFFLIAGPCVVEDEDTMYEIAQHLCKISEEFKLPVIFKASYMKANRTRLDSYMGGVENIPMLRRIKIDTGLPITTDFHSIYEIEQYAHSVDVIQIPAFLSRQTPLLVAAAKTGKWVNIKKGPFMSVDDMWDAFDKVVQSGNKKVMATERGTTFGYSDLIVDIRNIPFMQQYEAPVILDVTHSLGVRDGDVILMTTLARAGLAAGADGIFIETHPDPDKARSDGKRMLPLDMLENFIRQLINMKR